MYALERLQPNLVLLLLLLYFAFKIFHTRMFFYLVSLSVVCAAYGYFGSVCGLYTVVRICYFTLPLLRFAAAHSILIRTAIAQTQTQAVDSTLLNLHNCVYIFSVFFISLFDSRRHRMETRKLKKKEKKTKMKRK